jgi:predicted P-loop ATPase
MLTNAIDAVKDADAIPYTVFRSVTDIKSFNAHKATWHQIVAMIKAPQTYGSKKACPLMKLATFGDRANAQGSLRHDDNVELVYGVEGDYDANEVTPAEGARRLREAGVRAVIYTSATHGVACKKNPKGGPRWRVLAPLSGPVAPELRAELVSTLNGALGGILGGESWTLSQTFYFGQVADVAYEVHDIEGESLDLHAALGEIEPIGPPVAARTAAKLAASRRKQDADGAEIAHLRSRRLITTERADGAVDVLCPRWEMHGTEGATSGSTWFPAGVGGRSEGGFECRHQSCGKPTTSEFLNWSGLDKIVTARTIDEFEAQAPQTVKQADGAVVEVQPLPAFTRMKNGKVEATRNNLSAALSRPDLCGIHLRYDRFAASVMFAPVDRPAEWQAFTESSRTDLCRHLESGAAGFTFVHVPTLLAAEMVSNFAEHNQFDSAQTWLESLTWDGVSRVDSFLARHLRAQDGEYARAVSRYLLTALAGRVLEPGVKADMVPVFVGRQGAGKSSVVAALAPDPSYFLELDLSKAEDDRLREMAGRLVLELGELRGLRAREHEELKQFISRRVDSWIPKYKEGARNYPRRSVFIGTSNTPEFLSDETGNRRWLPIEVAGHETPAAVGLAVAAVAAERDQLWAEAAVLFRLGGVAWCDAEALAKPEHARFEIVEPWAAAIGQWLEADAMDGADGPKRGDAPFTTEQVLIGAVNVELRAINDAQRKRVAAVLRRLGYVDRRSKVAGLRSTFWARP